MSVQEMSPNDQVARVYEELGRLLDHGDDAFIEHGPGLLQDAIQTPGFFEGVTTAHASDSYTRKKVLGSEDGHVIRYMEWPPGYPLQPHEHHGRPCFEILVDGHLFIADMDAAPQEGDVYELDITRTYECTPGDAGVVDPRTGTDIHAVYSPVRSRSLHVYPDDNHYSMAYVPVTTPATGRDVFLRERFELKDTHEPNRSSV